eukprot:TRINITY_DN2641_c0_g3_i1.p1 TRINITY_DN2641_c0_g3~~TRINITY_DN2641_c0_g3_i1.p1  ORF type:complete len:325 (-),score=44.24 TRINITY_DN2641_c0_g3_i1:7-981(-)
MRSFAAPPSGSSEAHGVERVEVGSALSSCSAASLRVVSWNILAPCYVRVPNQPWNAFAHCTDADLDGPARLARVAAVLGGCGADVICLQEVMLELRPGGGSAGGPELAQWALPAWLDPLVAQDYAAVLQGLKQKEWEANADRNLRMVGQRLPTGVAILYRRSRWEEASVSQHGSGSGSVVFLRDRTAAPAEGEAAVIAVGNTHLVGDPAKADAHLQQLNGLLRSMGKCPHRLRARVICGDFNSECPPGSAVATWLATQELCDMQLGPTWAEPGRGLQLDHIAHSSELVPMVAYRGLDSTDIETGLPNARIPSDHLAIGVAFRLH